MTKFTETQLNALKAEFANIKTVSVDHLPKFHAMFDKMTDAQLAQLPAARINFLSKLAVNACIRRKVAFAF